MVKASFCAEGESGVFVSEWYLWRLETSKTVSPHWEAKPRAARSSAKVLDLWAGNGVPQTRPEAQQGEHLVYRPTVSVGNGMG